MSDLGRPNIVTRVLIRGRQKIRVREEAMMTETGQNDARDTGGLSEVEKARGQILPWNLV